MEPFPSKEYIAQASAVPIRLPNTQPLLIVLDLNGTLLERSDAGKTIHERPWLKHFLNYCLVNHTVLIWSSARASNVDLMCTSIFKDIPNMRKRVIAEWSRETLVEITHRDYDRKAKVFKVLTDVWDNTTIQSRTPYPETAPWSQANTILVDDTKGKAQAQPWNHILIPTYEEKDRQHEKETRQGLVQVLSYIEEASWYSDVSAFMKWKPFVADSAWAWDWQSAHPLRKDSEDDSVWPWNWQHPLSPRKDSEKE